MDVSQSSVLTVLTAGLGIPAAASGNLPHLGSLVLDGVVTDTPA